MWLDDMGLLCAAGVLERGGAAGTTAHCDAGGAALLPPFLMWNNLLSQITVVGMNICGNYSQYGGVGWQGKVLALLKL
jgi:hypothetical protein